MIRFLFVLAFVSATVFSALAEDAVRQLEGGITRVDFVLTPTTNSYIRCVLMLPAKDKWNGRFWGFGSGGGAGYLDANSPLAAAKGGSAGAHTDMGSSKGVSNMDAVRDFGHRATHLMAVESKRRITAFYGRPPDYSYFIGASTGGGQAIHEAQRYPEDFNGIIAGVPANTRIPLHVYFAWTNRALHDSNGREVFTQAELDAVKQAALDYFADKDEPWARGKFLTNPRYTPEAEAGILALAKKACPSLDTPDKLERLHRVFYGPVIQGRHVHSGVPFGGCIQNGAGNQWMLQWYLGKRPVLSATDEELAACMEKWGPDCNAVADDLSAFAKRGGKLLVYGGLEDAMVPCFSMMDWYDRLVARAGAYDKVAAFCRLYLLPGRRHGNGGENGVQGIDGINKMITEWVEKGACPGTVQGSLKNGTFLPVQPYRPR